MTNYTIVPNKNVDSHKTGSIGMKRFVMLGAAAAAVMSLSACNVNTIGAGMLGGAGGGFAGSQFGKGQGKLLATGGGALGGLLFGSYLGSILDGVGKNRDSIDSMEREAMNQRQMQKVQPYYAPSPYGNGNYNQGPNSVPVRCGVQNNRMICNSY